MTLRIVERVLSRLGGLNGAMDSGLGREQGADYYDTLYEGSEAYRSHYAQSHYYFLWAVIADRIRRSSLRRVLEIGCGPGQLASLLVESGVESYTGIDFSPVAVAAARKRVTSGTFEVGDARATTIYARVPYDVILCTEVLEHIEEDTQVVARFPAGVRCLCSVPNFAHESHVRTFTDAMAVAERYGPFFHELDVATFTSPNHLADKFFLLDGIRSGEPA